MKKIFVGMMVLGFSIISVGVVDAAMGTSPLINNLDGVSGDPVVGPSSVNTAPPAINPAITSTQWSADISSCRSLQTSGVGGVVGCIIGFFNYALILIMAAAFMYTIWGAFQLMREEKREEGKGIILYGIIGLFVMISVWGFVNILKSTFSLSASPIDPPKLTN